MWDQATFDLLEQTLQHPLWFCIHSGWPSEDKFIILTMERNHTDRTDITWLARTCRKGSIHNSCNVYPWDQKALTASVARAINESLWVVLKTWTAMMTGLSSRWISQWYQFEIARPQILPYIFVLCLTIVIALAVAYRIWRVGIDNFLGF